MENRCGLELLWKGAAERSRCGEGDVLVDAVDELLEEPCILALAQPRLDAAQRAAGVVAPVARVRALLEVFEQVARVAGGRVLWKGRGAGRAHGVSRAWKAMEGVGRSHTWQNSRRSRHVRS